MSRTFQGYRRPDGSVGVRNHVLVLSPTGLTGGAAARIGAAVRGTVVVSSGFGRGQVGADARLHFDTLSGLATNPNVAAVLVLGPSDEIAQSYVDAVAATGRPAIGYSLPGCGEDALALTDAGVRAAARLVREASAARREDVSMGELCVAVECGHSDATSGLVANPVAGRLVDMVVDAGGRALFSETVEWTGAEHVLARRAEDGEVARDIHRVVLAREEAVRAAGSDVRAQNPGPQNIRGGLSTIEEKALGAIAKGGSRPIRGVLAGGQRVPGPGLYLMDTPYFSPESISAMVAGGAQLALFTTGPGNSYGSLIAPTVKLSANREACARLPEQIDIALADAFDAGCDLDRLAERTAERLLAIASGTLTFGEIVGEGAEVVSRLGPSM